MSLRFCMFSKIDSFKRVKKSGSLIFEICERIFPRMPWPLADVTVVVLAQELYSTFKKWVVLLLIGTQGSAEK